MPAGFRVFLAIAALLMISCMAGVVTAASIGNEWKDRAPFEGSAYHGVMISPDGERVFTGGSQMYLRNWNGTQKWGGRAGFITAMSTDGNYIASGQGNSLVLLDKDGAEIWTRNMNTDVRAVAVSGNGTYAISADNQGNIFTWSHNGELVGRNKTVLVKQIAISPSDNLVVATTEGGLKFFTPALDPVWSDVKNGSIDNDIIFSGDGATIITYGGNRLSSHTNTGKLNWMNEVTKGAILGTACSYDCSVIVISSQDSSVQVLDRYGTIRWTYPVEQWVNSVGISQDARVIAGAGIDQNLYVLDHAGKLLAKKKMDTIIHPRSLAISGDGRRIVVADERALIGLSFSPDMDNSEWLTVIPTPARVTNTLTPVPTTEAPVVPTPVTTVPATPVPVTTTPKSPVDPVTAILALGAGLSLVQGARKP